MTFKREYERLNIKPYAPRMAPTPIPIPDPFDNPLRCLKINAAWASHLLGVLEALDQEDAWIGTDDEIDAARQWVREIAEYLLGDNCETPPVPEPPRPPDTGDQTGESIFIDCGCDGCDEGDCDMGCCYDKLEFRNGLLWGRRCGEWEKIAGQNNQSGTMPEDWEDTGELEPDDDVQAEDWRCAKSTVIAEAAFKILQAYLDNYTSNPINVINNIESDAGMQMNHIGITGLVLTLLADELYFVSSISDFNTEENKVAYKCRLMEVLDGSNNDLGANQWRMIVEEIQKVTTSVVIRLFLHDMMECAGLQNFRALTRIAVMSAYDCDDCGPQPISLIPDDVSHDWAHYYDFKVEEFGWTLMGKNASQADGQGIVSYPTAYNDALSGCKKNVATPAPDGFTFTFFWVKYTFWPTPNTGGVSYWFKIGTPGTVLLNDVSLFGLPIIQTRTNKHINQGEPVEIGSLFTYGNPPSGSSCLEALLIAGTGDDPWPDDPDYIPS